MSSNRYRINHRARLFAELSELEQKGEGGFDAVYKELGEGGDAAETAELEQLAEQFRSGQTALLDALRQSHGFLPRELPAIELGLATGDLHSVYLRLAEQYLLLGSFVRDCLRHAWLPLLVVLFTSIAVPFSAWSAGMLGPVDATLRALVGPLLLLACYGLGLWALRTWQRDRLPRWFAAVLWRFPGVGAMLSTARSYHFLCNLSLGLNASLPLQQSLSLAARHLPRGPDSERYARIHREVESGRRLSAALGESGILGGVALGSMRPGAGAADAHRHLTDAVHTALLGLMAWWSRWLPLMLLMLVPLLILLQLI